MALLAFHDVHALYGRARILNGVSFAVDAGERVALVGRNGVGKTTVVNTLCGATTISQGRIEIDGRAKSDLRGYTAAQHGIAIVMQGRGILPNLTVEENLLLGAATRRPGPWSLARVYEPFPALRERRANPGLALSGGQQQMLAIGRALMLRPRLMLLDEPSFGLAPMIVAEMFEILRTLNRSEKVSMLLVEQNAALALDLADHAYLIETGRLVMSGPSAEIRGDESIRRSYLGY